MECEKGVRSLSRRDTKRRVLTLKYIIPFDLSNVVKIHSCCKIAEDM